MVSINCNFLVSVVNVGSGRVWFKCVSSGWAFGQYVLGYVQGTAQNCPKLPKTPKTAQDYFHKNI